MEQEVIPTRRSVVTVGAAAALGVAGVGSLAACGSGSSDSATTTSAAAGGGATSAAAETSAAAATSALAKLADIPVGGALVSGELVLVQATAGQVTAFTNKCTHQGCALTVNGASLDCPCHGSTFDLTGKATKGPATGTLPTVAVTVDGDSVVKA